MNEFSFDYVAAQKALDIGDRTDTKALATVAKVHAQATVDIAASLAIIVELMQRDAPVNDSLTVEGGGLPKEEPESDRLDSANSAEPGDTVFEYHEEHRPVTADELKEVLEVGTTEGEVWLKLDGVKGKKWARDYVIVQRGAGGDFK